MTPLLYEEPGPLGEHMCGFDSEMLEGFVSARSEIYRFVTHSFPLFVSQNLQFVRVQRSLTNLLFSPDKTVDHRAVRQFWYMSLEHRTMSLFA